MVEPWRTLSDALTTSIIDEVSTESTLCTVVVSLKFTNFTKLDVFCSAI